MVSRIYTQADYDKITDLYNEYQGKKDTYTPEQQQSIESAFGNARAQVSNRIEESKNKLVDMYNDEQGNTWGEYGDGRKEILNAAPTPTPNPNIVPQKATRRTPEIPTNTSTPSQPKNEGQSELTIGGKPISELQYDPNKDLTIGGQSIVPAMSDDNYYNNWMNQLREEQYTIGGKPMTETTYNPNKPLTLGGQNVIPQSKIQSNSLLQGTYNPNATPTIGGKPTINVQYLLKNGWTIGSDGYMVDPQGNRRSNMYIGFMYQ